MPPSWPRVGARRARNRRSRSQGAAACRALVRTRNSAQHPRLPARPPACLPACRQRCTPLCSHAAPAGLCCSRMRARFRFAGACHTHAPSTACSAVVKGISCCAALYCDGLCCVLLCCCMLQCCSTPPAELLRCCAAAVLRGCGVVRLRCCAAAVLRGRGGVRHAGPLDSVQGCCATSVYQQQHTDARLDARKRLCFA